MDMTFDFGRAIEPALSLDEALAAIAAGRPVGDGHTLQGHVRLTGDGPDLSFYDDLQMLVPALTVETLGALAAGERADLRMASWDKVYALLRESDEIVVVERDEEVGDIELGRYPAPRWIDAMQDGRRRFVEFVDRLVAVEPQWRALAELLRGAPG